MPGMNQPDPTTLRSSSPLSGELKANTSRTKLESARAPS
jgi:hypothetical protein